MYRYLLKQTLGVRGWFVPSLPAVFSAAAALAVPRCRIVAAVFAISSTLLLSATFVFDSPALSQAPTKPGAPSNVSATSENLMIDVSWSATTETNVGPRTNYYVDWTPRDLDPPVYDDIFLNDETTYTISSYLGAPLIKGVVYSVCVFAYNQASAEFSDFVCAEVTVVGSTILVTTIETERRFGTSLKLNLTLDNPDLISTTARLRYRTAAVGTLAAGEWSADRTSTQANDYFSFTLADLARGTTYDVQATTDTDFNTAANVKSATFSTVAGPSVLQYDDYEAGTTTVDVSFDLENPDSETATVRLQYRTSERFGTNARPPGEWVAVPPQTTTTESIEFNLADLTPDESYNLWVTTAEDFDDPSLVYRLDARTLDDPIVTQVDVSNIRDISATVTATLFNPDSESLDVYIRFRSLSTSNFDETTQPVNTTGTSADFNLSGLMRGTEYLLHVSLDNTFATNVQGYRFTTLDVPDEPESVTVTAGDGTLTVTWAPPDADGGSAITGYVVQWRESGEDYTNSNEISISDTDPEFTSREVDIPNLTNHTMYIVRVLAINEFGRSSGSGEAAGTPNTGPEIEEVTVDTIRDVSVKVKVKTRYIVESADFVYLRYRPTLESDEAAWETERGLVSPTILEIEFLLTGLMPGTQYSLEASLDSTFAEEVVQVPVFRTAMEGMPDPPAAPNVNVARGDQQLSVNWSVTDDGGAEVTEVTITWWAEDIQPLQVMLTGFQGYYVISGLENGTTYNVQVIVSNSAGDSPATTVNWTPSSVPRSAVTELETFGCDRSIDLRWQAPSDDGGSPITGYRVQWTFGLLPYRTEREAIVTDGTEYTIGSLTDGTEYTVRVLAVNANGSAADSIGRPLWSESSALVPSEPCIANIRFGNILADSAPVIVDTARTEEGSRVIIRYRPIDATSIWSEVLSSDLAQGETSMTFEIRGLEPSTIYELEAWIGSQMSGEDLVARTFFVTGALLEGETAISGNGGGSIAPILRIEPAINSVTIRSGDKVVLSVEVWGRQGILGNSLADRDPADRRPEFDWTSYGGGSFIEAEISREWRNGSADDRTVLFEAPDVPGTFTVATRLEDPTLCLAQRDGETAADQSARCSAQIQITVIHRRGTEISTTAPVNPSGTIPETLSDSEGVAYAIFTPVEGGSFTGDGYSLTAGPGAVANGEYIGVSMTPSGDASNVGMTWHRYTLTGLSYSVGVIDGSGARVSEYALNEPVAVCVPMPENFGSNISDIVLTSTDEGALTVLSSRVKLTPSGVEVCGNFSRLPATLSVGKVGAPPEIEEPGGERVEQPLPDAGGSPLALPVLLLVLVLAAIAVPTGAMVFGRSGSSVAKQIRHPRSRERWDES